MFFLSTPDDDEVLRILAGLSDVPLNYAHEGATKAPLRAAPAGYKLTSYGMDVGFGEAVFDRARALLERFGHYPPSFTRVISTSADLEEGVVFGTLATHFGFASLHPCRVIRVIRDESSKRFGFTLGTLPGHIGAGEESFVVRLDEGDGVVRYEVQAISRPAGWLGLLGTPFFRLFQRRFARETRTTVSKECNVDQVGSAR